MQTKNEIQSLLAAAGAVPSHRLGQNFLIDQNLVEYLLGQAAIDRDDIVLEVGCGTGTLSEGLCERAGAVVIVEYDRLMCRITEGILERFDNITMINADVLANKNSVNEEALAQLTRLRARFGGRLMLVANLPYQIAASLMCNLVTGTLVFDAMYITVQKEVAMRMSAGAGDKLYGILSIIVQACGDAKYLKTLPPDVFWPAPAVESAMVSYQRNDDKCGRVQDIGVLKRVVSVFMGHRRKMMKACVKFAKKEFSGISDWNGIFVRAGINPTLRPERIGPDEYVRLANCLKTAGGA